MPRSARTASAAAPKRAVRRRERVFPPREDRRPSDSFRLWTAAVCAFTGFAVASLGAVHDVFPRGDLTPPAFHTAAGAAAPLLERGRQVFLWYAGFLAVFGGSAAVLRGNVAGAATAAGTLALLLARSPTMTPAAALGAAVVPAAAYWSVARLAHSRRMRGLLIAGAILGALLPLEAFFLRLWIDFAPAPSPYLQELGWPAAVLIAASATAAPAAWLLPGKARRTALAAAAAAAVGGVLWADPGVSASAGVSRPSGPPAIVWITADTLRADAVAFGADSPTPALAGLARDSAVFTEALAPAPWTLPSLTSLLTGYAPSVHGVGLRRSDLSLPLAFEYFRDAGYRTAAFIGNPILQSGAALHDARLRPRLDFYRGADFRRIFHDRRYGGSRGADSLYERDPARWFDGGATFDQTEYVLGWLDDHAEAPFFLWTHYYDPHWPFAPPADYLPAGLRPPPGRSPRILDAREARLGTIVYDRTEQAWMRALYDAEVRWVDSAVGRILERLRSLGLYDDALIVFTSDHGEEFWEHGRFGHGHALYREVLHVPLVVKAPGNAAPRTIKTPVSARSVLPTTLDLAEIPHRAPEAWAPSLAAPAAPRPLIAEGVELFENEETVFFDGFQLIRRLQSGKIELFDLAADPKALRSIAGERPDLVARGLELLTQRQAEAEGARAAHGAEEREESWDPATLERLRSLGYL